MFKGTFFVDFVSTFPFSEVGTLFGATSFGYQLFANMMKLLKALRLKKILKKIRDMPITIEQKAMAQVLYFAFLIFVYTHVIGCIMWLSLKTNEIWIPAVDFGSVDVKVHESVRYNADGEVIELNPNYILMYEWMSAWYNAAIGFALVETNPRTQSQITLMFGIYVLNAMINAYLIGVFIDQMSVKNEKRAARQDELDDLNLIMSTSKCVP